MKKTFLLVLVSGVFSFNIYAQDKKDETPNIYKTPSSDFVMLQLTNALWLNTPDSIHKSSYSPEVSVYVNKEFPINQSHFAVSVGVGVSASNNFFKENQSLSFKASDSTLTFVDDSANKANNIIYRKYKYTQIFLEAPLELRYYGNINNKNVGFKMAIGVKVGNLLSAHTKGKYTYRGADYKDKEYTTNFAEKWRLSPYMRIGWGNFSLIGSYQLTPIFKANTAPSILPLNIGICISGL